MSYYSATARTRALETRLSNHNVFLKQKILKFCFCKRTNNIHKFEGCSLRVQVSSKSLKFSTVAQLKLEFYWSLAKRMETVLFSKKKKCCHCIILFQVSQFEQPHCKGFNNECLTILHGGSATGKINSKLLFSTLNFYTHSPVTKGSIIFISLELLLEALFKPGQHLNPEHKYKYVYLLAYAASVHETWIEVVCL